MNTHADSEEYETHDIYLAAYYKVAGCSYLRKYRQGRRVIFVFSNPGGTMREMREAFFSGKGMVVASEYADAVRKYKELCHDPSG